MSRLTCLILAVWALAMMGGQSAGEILPQLKAAGTLRVCADPQNLPFSSQDPQQPGFEVELAREIAQELGLRAELVWIDTLSGRRALRQLLDGQCDLFMGLPQDARFLEDYPRLILSTVYYTMAHVLLLPAGTAIRQLQELGDKPVAVEYASLGAIFAFQQGHPQRTYTQQEDLFRAVATGEAAAALMWAPIAGWLVKTHPEAKLHLVLMQGHDLEFPMGIGMRKTAPDLKDAVDEILQKLSQRQAVANILQRYGIPLPSRQSATDQPIKTASEQSIRGESLYRQTCSECHGLNAKGSTVAPNLTTYKQSDDAFVKAVLNGRPATPMPPFKGILTEADARQIRSYIKGLPQ
jgi:ABC-type amino acid transport substrate-binding protein